MQQIQKQGQLCGHILIIIHECCSAMYAVYTEPNVPGRAEQIDDMMYLISGSF